MDNNNNMDTKSPRIKRRMISTVEFSVDETPEVVPQVKKTSHRKRSGERNILQLIKRMVQSINLLSVIFPIKCSYFCSLRSDCSIRVW